MYIYVCVGMCMHMYAFTSDSWVLYLSEYRLFMKYVPIMKTRLCCDHNNSKQCTLCRLHSQNYKK